MAYIKPDPEMQEEQEDLIMSYLNADYLSTDNTTTPLSPPSSVTTSSASSSGGLSPEKHIVDDFMLDINSTDFLTGTDSWATSADSLFNPCFPQQDQVGGDLLSAFPFFLPNTAAVAAAAPNFIQPFPTILSPPTVNVVNTNNSNTSSSSSTGSLSDSEQPKKKRGRKKREPVVYQNTSPVQPSLLAPKPLAPRPNSNNDLASTIIKSESVISATPTTKSSSPQPTSSASTAVMAGQTSSTTPTSNVKNEGNTNESLEAQKQAQIQKRQERLIKNRAAALLSRKRKREHLTCLEEEKQLLVNENEKLNEKVVHLESRIQTLEKENLDLKQRLQLTSNPTSTSVVHIGQSKRPLGSPKSTKTTGVVFMIILFSFALFTLPSRTADRLTVGGSGSMMMENTRKQFPLIGSSSSSLSSEYNSMDMLPTTDLVLIDSVVRPRDLQTWINHKLDSSTIQSGGSNSNVIGGNGELQTWASTSDEQQQPSQPRHVYLYSKEFSQIAPMNPVQPFATNSDLPILSLISPYNQTLSDQDQDEDEEDGCQVKKYLQIDVQVLRSQVIRSQLLPLEQCETASTLLDGMKKDILSHSHHQFNNVTPATVSKREKRAANKKLARVIV